MDIEALTNQLGWKKIAAIMIVLSILFLIVIVASLNNSKSPESSNNATAGGPSQQPAKSILITPTQALVWKTYQSTDFKIDYPSSMTVLDGVTSTNDFSVLFSSNVKTQRFEIQAYGPQTITADRLIQTFTKYNYTRSSMLVSGINAEVFKGSIVLSPQHLQELIVIFQVKNKTYKIQASYDSINLDSTIEQNFTRMIQSFSLL